MKKNFVVPMLAASLLLIAGTARAQPKPVSAELSLQSGIQPGAEGKNRIPMSRSDPAYTEEGLDLFPAIYLEVTFADGTTMGPHDYKKDFAGNVVFDDATGDPDDLIEVVYRDVDDNDPQAGKYAAQLTSTGNGVGIAYLNVSFRNAPDVTSRVEVEVVSGPRPWGVRRIELKDLFTIAAGTDVTSVAFSPDGTRIASGGWDNKVKLWDAGTGAETSTISLEGHGDLVLGVAFSPDGNRIASSSRDYETNFRTVGVWDASTGSEALVLQNGPPQLCYDVAFSPDGKTIMVGCWDGSPEGKGARSTFAMWDASTGYALLTETGNSRPVAFSPDGGSFASRIEGAARIQLWDATTREKRSTISTGINCKSLAFGPDGNRMVCGEGSEQGTIKVWDAQTGEEQLTLEGHAGGVNDLAFSPDGTLILSAGADGALKLWDAGTGQEIWQVQSPPNDKFRDNVAPFSSVAFSPDGSRVISGSRDRTIRAWRLSG